MASESVFLDSFDRGLIVTLGASLLSNTLDEDGARIPYAIVKDGETRPAYAIDMTGVVGPAEYWGSVPVFFEYPEDVFSEYKLPCIVVKRTGLNPAFDRTPTYGIQSRKPATGAIAKTITLPDGTELHGYDRYVTRWHAQPYDIPYEVSIRCRRQGEFQKMLKAVIKVVKAPAFTVYVVDGIGDERTYDAVGVDISNNSDLSSIANRSIMWSASFEVRGELDVDDGDESVAVTKEPQVTIGVSDG